MSLNSLFKNPNYLIHRFRYHTLYLRSFWIYILLAAIVGIILYYIVNYPIYSIIASGILVVLSRFLNKLYDAIISARQLEIRKDTTTPIYRDIEEVKEIIRFNRPLRVYLKRNSYSVKCLSFLGTRRLFIGVELLQSDIDERQFKYLIAQALLQCKIKRMLFWILEPFIDDLERLQIFNIFLYSYDRAATYTADRIATLLSGAHDHCSNIMRRQIVGNTEYDIRAQDFLRQAEITDDFFGWFINIFLKHPSPIRRMKQIQIFYEKYRVVYAKRHEDDSAYRDNIAIPLELY